jgi:hypothetical protein
MTTTHTSIHLKEWESLSANDPGSRLAGVFLEDNDKVKNIASVLSKMGMSRLPFTQRSLEPLSSICYAMRTIYVISLS